MPCGCGWPKRDHKISTPAALAAAEDFTTRWQCSICSQALSDLDIVEGSLDPHGFRGFQADLDQDDYTMMTLS